MSRSFLKWAGSKKKLIPSLLHYWDERFIRYIEPFMGSAQLFYAIECENAILSDINAELVNTYIEIRENADIVYNFITGMDKTEANYYKIREMDLDKMNSTQRAARFIYLNRFCFNGLYRTNAAGKFNVPYSNSKNDYLPSLELLKDCAQKLKKAKIVCSDFEKILIDEASEGDFFYIDPPYAVKNNKIFNQYGPDTFGLNDIERLKKCLFTIEKRGAKFLLSYAYCDEALESFGNWNSCKIQTQRNIAGFTKHRRIAEELLISNI